MASAAIVLEMDGETSKSARIVVGRSRTHSVSVGESGGDAAGQRIIRNWLPALAKAAVEGANPLAKNADKVPLTKALVRPTLVWLAQRA